MKNNIKKLLREEVSKQNLKYEFEHLDSYSGQNNYELGLYLNNEIIGTVEYTTYDGFITVSDILVRPEYRRKGYGSKMMKAIKENHPEFKYKPSFKTDLGAKFKHKDVDLYKEGQINESKSSIKQLLREGLLKEGASPILYHFTRLGALENILSNNSFYLTSNIGSPSDRLGGDEVYYMSFSRTKSNKQGYGARWSKN
jgi:GNAT superfamily N-acetyltransferase